MGIAVVICAYTEARWDQIGQAVASVEDQSLPAEQIILVVDHCPPLLERAQRTWPQHTIVANAHERGLSGARNSGVSVSRAEWVAFLDDDAVAQPSWLERMADHFDRPTIGGVGGLVRPAWTTGQPAWFPEEFLWVVGCSYRGLPEVTAPIRNPIGANMAFRREVILAVGGFAEGIGRVGTLPVGCEETELSIRARAQGWEILYEPASVVDHLVPADRGRPRYFANRCLAEGRSKAAVTRLAGASSALQSERRYTARVLPAGVWAALRAAWRGPARRAAIARAGAIPSGLALAALGYSLEMGALRSRREPRGQRAPVSTT